MRNTLDNSKWGPRDHSKSSTILRNGKSWQFFLRYSHPLHKGKATKCWKLLIRYNTYSMWQDLCFDGIDAVWLSEPNFWTNSQLKYLMTSKDESTMLGSHKKYDFGLWAPPLLWHDFPFLRIIDLFERSPTYRWVFEILLSQNNVPNRDEVPPSISFWIKL